MVHLDFFEECQQLKHNQFLLLDQILQLELNAKNLSKVKQVLLNMCDILLLNPAFITKVKSEKIKGSLAYCEKALGIYGSIDSEEYDEMELLDRVALKLTNIYFH